MKSLAGLIVAAWMVIPRPALADACSAEATILGTHAQEEMYLFTGEIRSDDCATDRCVGEVRYQYEMTWSDGSTSKALSTGSYVIDAGRSSARFSFEEPLRAPAELSWTNLKSLDVHVAEVTCHHPA